MVTSYMKPTIGGPHWKVSFAGNVEKFAPEPASCANSPVLGFIQVSRVSQRSLVNGPSMITSASLIVDALTCWVYRPEVADVCVPADSADWSGRVGLLPPLVFELRDMVI